MKPTINDIVKNERERKMNTEQFTGDKARGKAEYQYEIRELIWRATINDQIQIWEAAQEIEKIIRKQIEEEGK